MRHRYLVCYDISDPKRLQRTFKKMHGFGDPVQYSIFSCDLLPRERVLLEEALTELINLREDRVMIVDLGPVDGRGRDCFAFLGMAKRPQQRGAVVL